MLKKMALLILACCLLSGCHDSIGAGSTPSPLPPITPPPRETDDPSQAKNTPPKEERETAMFQQYYEVISDLIQTHGFCVAEEEYDWSYSGKGFYHGELHDFDEDGTEELICLYWKTPQEMYVQLYCFMDGQAKLLLEREVPTSQDNCKMINLPDVGNPYLSVYAPEYSSSDSVADAVISHIFYAVKDGVLSQIEFYHQYDNGNPQDSDALWKIDGQEVDWATYQEAYAPYRDREYHVMPVMVNPDTQREETILFVKNLGELAGVPSQDIDDLLEGASSI